MYPKIKSHSHVFGPNLRLSSRILQWILHQFLLLLFQDPFWISRHLAGLRNVGSCRTARASLMSEEVCRPLYTGEKMMNDDEARWNMVKKCEKWWKMVENGETWWLMVNVNFFHMLPSPVMIGIQICKSSHIFTWSRSFEGIQIAVSINGDASKYLQIIHL